ncbi:hypothetical protein ACET3Z_016777 [Daucus carota]
MRLGAMARGLKFGSTRLSRKRKRDDDDAYESTRRIRHGLKRRRRIPILKIGDRINLSKILFTKHRDFLVTYKNRNSPVHAEHLEGKTVVLHFVPLVPWNSHLRLYVESLIDTYKALHPDGGFEVVFVGVKIGTFPSDPHTLLNPSLEKCFEEKFSIMPWTAVPFSDIVSQKSLERRLRFPFSRFVYDVYTVSVVLDPSGLVLQCQADDFFLWYGARAYPFTLERIDYLMSADKEMSKHPSVTRLLTSFGRDYVINKDNQEVPVRDLENKVVALYFYEDFPIDDLTEEIQVVYEKFADRAQFEIVLVYVHDSFDSCEFASEKSFWKKLNKMSWLALPFKDPRCKYLKRIFNYPAELNGWDPDPRLVIIGPQGKYFEPYGADILNRFGISAFPFTRRRAAELESESEYIKSLKLDMLLDPRTSFTQANGTKVKLSQLMGKRIMLIIENGWGFRYPEFWTKLKEIYLKMKNTENEFEVLHAPYECVAHSYAKYVGTIPWLRHSTFRLQSKKYAQLQRVFRGGVGLLAFDPDGRIVRKTKYPSIEEENFPFYAGSLFEEALRGLAKKFEWDRWLVEV